MAAAVWKIPTRWTGIALPDRTVLYPALYLRWAGHRVAIDRAPPPGLWSGADLRVMVVDGALAEDERELMVRTSARGQSLVLAPQGGLAEPDRAFVAQLGFPLIAWIDPGPLASYPPRRAGIPLLRAQGCAARAAEDLLLLGELVGGPAEQQEASPKTRLLVAAESAQAVRDAWPVLPRADEILVTSDDAAALEEIRAFAGVGALSADDPRVLTAMAQAETFLCLYPQAAPDSPRPGQWVRSALFQGVPVVAASHPSIDGLAHLCVMDDIDRGLALFGHFPEERLRVAAAGQAFLEGRLDPDAILADWTPLLETRRRAPAPVAPASTQPLLLALIDIHQDLDILLPVLLTLRRRGEVRLRVAVTDWLLVESPRVLNALAAQGFDVEVHPREAVRQGDLPLLGGVDGVLCAADTNVRAHKSGHTLTSRANARGARTYTLQHGLENIGLTYKDHLHGEDVRFSAQTIFTWAGPERLAAWATPETRAAVMPVGSPKAVGPATAAIRLNQGHWPRTVGVFENLHWHRFSDAYRDQVLADLRAAADAHADTLFLIKPHHAGRWTSRNPDRVTQSANLVVIDPTDSAWEPHTAPALIASVDLVLTTPSTVALDAARTGKRVAVLGYGLELPLYDPLPIIQSLADLDTFLEDDSGSHLLRNEAFLRGARVEGRADHRIASRIAADLTKVRNGKRTAAVRG